MESVAEDILREILLKLPTRDVMCGRCVSRLWRRVLTDPSFLHLHAHATHVVSSAGAGTEALLLSVTHTPGTNPETAVFNVSTSTAMCALDVTVMYGSANACNGFVLLAANSGSSCQLPVFVCNPITGDKLRVEPPPKSETSDAPLTLRAHSHMYAMGYSTSTRQYKLFRLSFAAPKNYVHVLTLGRGPEAGVWRRHQGSFGGHGMGSPPVHIDGKLYVLAKKQQGDRKPDRLLVFDVAGETQHACRLPTCDAGEAQADILELHGRPCLALHEQNPFHRLQFWVLTPLRWELRYSFETGVNNGVVAELRHLTDLLRCRHHHHPRAAWLDGDEGMLCYQYGDRVYKYDTTEGRRPQPPGYNKVWDHHHRLPISDGCQWSIFGGYRPNLLSPHDLATAPQQAEERLEHQVLRVLRSHKPPKKRQRSPCPPMCDRDDERAAKLQKSS